jgi:co-chaperonin GroES (HSP10)
MITPVNDYFMVEIEQNPGGFVDTLDVNQEGIMEGKIISISDSMTFFGFNSFMFDKSLNDKELLKDLHNHYSKWVGKKVYWPLRTESGAVIKTDGKEYVFLKMTAIMAVEGDS